MRQPVRKVLKDFAYLCHSREDYQQQLVKLQRVVKTEEWKIVVQILWMIKNKMATELLESEKLTGMDSAEKDIVQRVYHEVNEIIDFLTTPLNWISKKGLLARSLSRVKKEREAQNGRGTDRTTPTRSTGDTRKN